MFGSIEPYKSWRHIQFRKWLSEGKVISASIMDDKKLDLRGRVGVLLKGSAVTSDEGGIQIDAPLVLTRQFVTLNDDAWVFVRIKESLDE